ncbi:MAG: peptidoglycan-binding protein LysM [Flavobacteriaceae bacterium]
MKKKISIALILLSIISYSFLKNNYSNDYHKADDTAIVTVPLHFQPEEIINFPSLGKSFLGFKEALGFKESRGDYNCVNTLGYLGKYQFGKSTLKRFNIHNTSIFLKDSEMQEDVFVALCSVNKWILRKDIKRKVGRRMNGILITESGILAASHLAGAGNVKKYLRSNGKENFSDAYGSNIEHYLKKFSGYDTSHIVADRKATI